MKHFIMEFLNQENSSPLLAKQTSHGKHVAPSSSVNAANLSMCVTPAVSGQLTDEGERLEHISPNCGPAQ